MTVFDDDQLSLELDQIALSVSHQESDPEVLALACLALVARKAIAESFGEARGTVAGPLIELGDRCVFTYADQAGIQRQRVLAAIQRLDQATSVYEYLSNLP